MAEVTVFETEDHQEPNGDEVHETEAVQAVAEATVETTQAETDAAVTIAAINADRDVEVAQIHATVIGEEVEGHLRAEIEECRTLIAAQNQSNIDLQNRLEEALTRLSSTEQSLSLEVGEVQGDVEVTPVSPEEHADPIQEPAPRKTRSIRWI
jgi:hypothetical protein